MRAAIVTGGTRGIGYAIAAALLESGARVMITGRQQRGVDAAVAELAASARDSGRVAGRAVDVRSSAAATSLVSETVERFGSLDILINNAGVGAFSTVENTTDEVWARVIDTNLTGVFYCCRAAIPAMRKAGGGWIINIASLAGRNAFVNGGAYGASKAGLVSFTESLMLEVREDNIRVSVVMPGSVATEFSTRPGSQAGDAWKLAPDDIARVVMDLLGHPVRSMPSKVEIRPTRTKSS
jgi:NAD(P)-dependent dehydrogenase (short-subunit alcohol dehydrogenase family)